MQDNQKDQNNNENQNIIRFPFPMEPAQTPSPEMMEYLRKLQTMDEIYVVLSTATKQPYIVCDPESFHDQVWIYEQKEDAEKRADALWAEKYRVSVATIPNQTFLSFYSSLLSVGADCVLLHEAPADGQEAGNVKELELKSIVRQPDFSKLPEQQRPVFNPQMQLSGIYFMQEYRREVSRAKKPRLAELEEEAISTLTKSRFLLPLTKKEDNTIAAPFIKSENGEVFQPLFTDMAELRKYDPKAQLAAITVPFAELEKVMIPAAKGIVVNPQGICMAVNREKFEDLKARFL